MKLVVSYVRLSEKDRNLKELYSDSINHQRILIKNYISVFIKTHHGQFWGHILSV